MDRLGKQMMQLLLVLALAVTTLAACGVAQTGTSGAGSTASASVATTPLAPSASPAARSQIAASAVPSAPTSTAQSDPVTDQASLLKALQTAGATVAVNGQVQQSFLQVPGTQVTVEGQDVQVFEYRDTAAAQAEATKLADVLAGKGTTMVSWVAAPHAYQAGRLLALYIGDDSATLQRLQQVLGAPIAEQQYLPTTASTPSSANPTASPGAEPLDLQSLIDALQAKGLHVTPGNKVIQPFFSIEGRAYKVNGADIQMFEFPEEAGAQSSMAKLNPDGNPPNTMIDWVGPPHFYQAGRVVALYVGDDQKIMDALTAILGPQRAGK